MIRVIDGFPDNVVGIVAQGRVTAADCDKILKPVMETSLKRHDKVRLYYEIGSRIPRAQRDYLRLRLGPPPPLGGGAGGPPVRLARQTPQPPPLLLPHDIP